MDMKRSQLMDETPADVLQETLHTAEKVVSFYEDCLDVVVARNTALEAENERLHALLRKNKKKLFSPLQAGRAARRLIN